MGKISNEFNRGVLTIIFFFCYVRLTIFQEKYETTPVYFQPWRMQHFPANLCRFHYQVPLSWSSHLEGPEDPIHWLRALVAKTLALGSWVEKCNSDSLLGDVLDLSELFHPDTFLNALRQQTAR